MQKEPSIQECAMCRRPLASPDRARHDSSIHGDCWLDMEDKVRQNRKEGRDPVAYQPYYPGGDISVSRAHNEKRSNVPRAYLLRSPTGYDWGYVGSGPAELALNILLMFTNVRFALDHYDDFSKEFVVALPHETGGTISEAVIRAWVAMRAPADGTAPAPR